MNITTLAAAAGSIAFHTGRPCIPARDGRLTELLAEEGLPLARRQHSPALAAWVEAWQTAAAAPAWPMVMVNADDGTIAQIMPLPPYVGRLRNDYRVSLWDTDAGMEAVHVFVSDLTAALATARTIANVAG